MLPILIKEQKLLEIFIVHPPKMSFYYDIRYRKCVAPYCRKLAQRWPVGARLLRYSGSMSAEQQELLMEET